MPKSGHKIDFSLCIIHYNFEKMAANACAFLSQIFFTYLSKWPQNWIAGKFYVCINNYTVSEIWSGQLQLQLQLQLLQSLIA